MQTSSARVIFGMKLKQIRHARGLSLQQFSELLGLSTSYLNEIEKGKKYPKVEKVEQIAKTLGVSFDELVSQRLDNEHNYLETFLQSPALKKFPLHLFGLTIQDLIALVPYTPKEGNAFVKALLDAARSYDLRIEDFFHTALRCYQEMHQNYFEDLESEVDNFRKTQGWKENAQITREELYRVLKSEYGYDIDEQVMQQNVHLRELRSISLNGIKPRLLINGNFTDIQKAFIAARELGYQVLKLSPRGHCSPDIEVESFEQVLSAFKASYFASALFMNRYRMKNDLKHFFKNTEWKEAEFLALLKNYPVTPEMFFYRLSEILPQMFNIKQLHFLRFDKADKSDYYELTKHLNMSQVRIPTGIELHEHFCRRWLSVRIIERLAASKDNAGNNLVAGIQRSTFLGGSSEFLCISVARRLVLTPNHLSSITIGFLMDDNLSRTIRFSADPQIPVSEIGETCERCPLSKSGCSERAAQATVYLRDQRKKAQLEEVKKLIASNI